MARRFHPRERIVRTPYPRSPDGKREVFGAELFTENPTQGEIFHRNLSSMPITSLRNYTALVAGAPRYAQVSSWPEDLAVSKIHVLSGFMLLDGDPIEAR